jgi:hypothetical protein
MQPQATEPLPGESSAVPGVWLEPIRPSWACLISSCCSPADRSTHRLEEVLADLAAMLFNRVPDNRRPAGRLVLPAVNQASSLSSPSPACQATAGGSRLPVRIQALAVSAGTTVTVTGLRRMPVDIAVRSVCSLG